MQKDSYNRGGFIAFLFSMTFSLAFFVYVTVVHPGIDLKEVPHPNAQPGQTQVQAGASAEAGSDDADVSKIDKPWEPSDAMVKHGHHIFSVTCAVCHGQKGLGDGPAGTNLNPKPRNFVEGKWKNGGDSATLFKTISTGISGSAMASFAHLPAKDRWALVQFVRSITKNKIKDDPKKLDAFGPTAK